VLFENFPNDCAHALFARLERFRVGRNQIA
jgi:hypothetical protein